MKERFFFEKMPLNWMNFRDIVGNNPYYGPSNNANGWNNEQYDPMMLYRDAMKQNFTPLSRSGSGYSK